LDFLNRFSLNQQVISPLNPPILVDFEKSLIILFPQTWELGSKNLIIEQAEEGGYFAYCPEIKGANGQGETIESCYRDLELAIKLVLEELFFNDLQADAKYLD
jgi:predicted RNase H-like HicB family nuclease